MPEFLLVQRKEIRALAERDELPDFERRNALAPGTVTVSRIGFDASVRKRCSMCRSAAGHNAATTTSYWWNIVPSAGMW
jgi:hypothetical protein